eukprot:3199869-Pyramimonas_sp.AAC.1
MACVGGAVRAEGSTNPTLQILSCDVPNPSAPTDAIKCAGNSAIAILQVTVHGGSLCRATCALPIRRTE